MRFGAQLALLLGVLWSTITQQKQRVLC